MLQFGAFHCEARQADDMCAAGDSSLTGFCMEFYSERIDDL